MLTLTIRRPGFGRNAAAVQCNPSSDRHTIPFRANLWLHVDAKSTKKKACRLHASRISPARVNACGFVSQITIRVVIRRVNAPVAA